MIRLLLVLLATAYSLQPTACFAQGGQATALRRDPLTMTRLARGFPGANAGAQIAAAFADLPATGGGVDARGFEGAQTVSTDIFTAVTKNVRIEFGAATYALGVDVTVPANIELVLGNGAIIDHGVHALTINGPWDVTLTKHLVGTGAVTFGNSAAGPYIVPQWWGGGFGLGAVVDTAAVQAAIDAAKASSTPVGPGGVYPLYFPPGNYLINTSLNGTSEGRSGWEVYGAGKDQTSFSCTLAAAYPCLDFTGNNRMHIHGFAVWGGGGGAQTAGLLIGQTVGGGAGAEDKIYAIRTAGTFAKVGLAFIAADEVGVHDSYIGGPIPIASTGADILGVHSAYKSFIKSAQTITDGTPTNPVILTVPVAPANGVEIGIVFATGDWIGINGVFTATHLSDTTFSIPVNGAGYPAFAGQVPVLSAAATYGSTRLFIEDNEIMALSGPGILIDQNQYTVNIIHNFFALSGGPSDTQAAVRTLTLAPGLVYLSNYVEAFSGTAYHVDAQAGLAGATEITGAGQNLTAAIHIPAGQTFTGRVDIRGGNTPKMFDGGGSIQHSIITNWFHMDATLGSDNLGNIIMQRGAPYWSLGTGPNLYLSDDRIFFTGSGGFRLDELGNGYGFQLRHDNGLATFFLDYMTPAGLYDSPLTATYDGDVTILRNLGINDVAYTWPGSQGDASTVLTNDGAGNLSWAEPGTCPTCVVTTGEYSDPDWITSLAASKITGAFGNVQSEITGGNQAYVARTITSGNPSYRLYDDSTEKGGVQWDRGADTVNIQGPDLTNDISIDSIGKVTIRSDLKSLNGVSYAWPGSQGDASTVLTNDGAGNLSWAEPGACPTCVLTSGEYSDPDWITSLAASKITGAFGNVQSEITGGNQAYMARTITSGNPSFRLYDDAAEKTEITWDRGTNVFEIWGPALSAADLKIDASHNINVAVGALQMGGIGVLSAARVLSNITADAGIISSGTFEAARLPSLRGGILTAFCGGAFPGGTTVYLPGLGGGGAQVLYCTLTSEISGMPATSAATAKNLRVNVGTAGCCGASGVVTLRVAGSNTALTCTVGTGTNCADTAHSVAVSAGQMLTVSVATGSPETLANMNVGFELW